MEEEAQGGRCDADAGVGSGGGEGGADGDGGLHVRDDRVGRDDPDRCDQDENDAFSQLS